MFAFRFFLCWCLFFVAPPGRAERPPFLSVSPIPPDHIWWLRTEYNPFSKSVRGIPVKLLAKDWCFANEFTTDLFPPEYLRDIAPGLSFSVNVRFVRQRPLQALVGAFETCAGAKGLFLLILEERKAKKIVRHLDVFPFQNSLAVLNPTPKGTLRLWWCSSCDNFIEIEWNSRQKKFVWVSEEIFENEIQPDNSLK
jgi:hypothetical protein